MSSASAALAMAYTDLWNSTGGGAERDRLRSEQDTLAAQVGTISALPAAAVKWHVDFYRYERFRAPVEVMALCRDVGSVADCMNARKVCFWSARNGCSQVHGHWRTYVTHDEWVAISVDFHFAGESNRPNHGSTLFVEGTRVSLHGFHHRGRKVSMTLVGGIRE